MAHRPPPGGDSVYAFEEPALREDKRAIFRACRFAREASEYLPEPLNRNTEQAA